MSEGPGDGPGADGGERPEGPEMVGSLGDEAAKLLAALQGWAKESGSEYAGATLGAASGVASAVREVNEHVATGDQDCQFCPVCQVISAVRQTSPEVREHLRSAAGSLLQAAAGVLATPTPKPDRSGPVEKIDLSDDWPQEDD